LVTLTKFTKDIQYQIFTHAHKKVPKILLTYKLACSRRHAEVVHLWLQHINCIKTNNAAHYAVLCCYVTALKKGDD